MLSGIFEEEGNLNLEEAMSSYQSAIDRFDSQRAATANAVFRLGECYRKLGKAEEAKAQYARILREFPDQADLARLSQKLLFAEPPRATGNRGAFQQRLQSIIRRAEANTPEEAGQQAQAVSPRQMKLLEEEIKLVQEQIKEAQIKVQHGTGSPTEIFTLKRELLELQRKLAAFEDAAASRLLAVPSPSPVPPPISTPGTGADLRETRPPGAPSSVQFQPSALAARAGRAEPGAAPQPRPLPTRALPRRSSALEEKKAQLQSDLARVREQLFNAETQCELSNEIMQLVARSDPATLPDQAGADPRYQKLKQEYEDALLSNAEEKERKMKTQEALRKIEIWVKSIYRPELQAKDLFAQTQYRVYKKQAEDLQAQLRKLQEEEDKAQAEEAKQNSGTREPLHPAAPAPPAQPAPAAPPTKS
ncbi:MAG: tetratricopeptide repeat protein [Chloroflexi bacterium]|nr:tetratricopeptide repeat protein [Chloroflexota bacterium]